jgi:hypothetical protein
VRRPINPQEDTMPSASKATTPVAIDLDGAPHLRGLPGDRATADHVGTVASDRTVLANRLVQWLEDGVRRPDLFAADAFADLSLPQWRIQATTAEALFGIRETTHPVGGRVRVERLEPTDSGFVIQFEERWHQGGEDWYCREMIHAVVEDGRITELSIYCTGDWDEATQRRHAAEVQLTRS